MDEEKYENAVNKSELDEIIKNLPDKDDTFRERGTKLSGGQQQRVSMQEQFIESLK